MLLDTSLPLINSSQVENKTALDNYKYISALCIVIVVLDSNCKNYIRAVGFVEH